MFGDGENGPDPAAQTALVTEVHKAGLVALLIQLLPRLYFETRKDAAATFNALVRTTVEPGNALPLVDFLSKEPAHLITILKGSELVGEWSTTDVFDVFACRFRESCLGSFLSASHNARRRYIFSTRAINGVVSRIVTNDARRR